MKHDREYFENRNKLLGLLGEGVLRDWMLRQYAKVYPAFDPFDRSVDMAVIIDKIVHLYQIKVQSWIWGKGHRVTGVPIKKWEYYVNEGHEDLEMIFIDLLDGCVYGARVQDLHAGKYFEGIDYPVIYETKKPHYEQPASAKATGSFLMRDQMFFHVRTQLTKLFDLSNATVNEMRLLESKNPDNYIATEKKKKTPNPQLQLL